MRQLVNRDVLLDGLDVNLDLLQRPRRRVLVEVAVEVDLVADAPDLVVLVVAFIGVDLGAGDVGRHLTLEESLDALRERHALGVAQVGIGHGVPCPYDLTKCISSSASGHGTQRSRTSFTRPAGVAIIGSNGLHTNAAPVLFEPECLLPMVDSARTQVRQQEYKGIFP